ncbi:MAG: universal stress protein [Pseudomonadota bacterium]
MTDAPADLGPFRNVLAIWDRKVDNSTLRAAADLAARYGASLTVLSCVEPPSDLHILARVISTTAEDLLARLVADRQEQIADSVARALSGSDAKLVVARGKPFIEIVRHAVRAEIDIVVKTAEPLSGVAGFLFASTDHHLMRKCPCPVWLHRPADNPAPSTVIAGVDVDEWDAAEPETLHDLNRRVIEIGCRIASGPGATVHVLHAWEAMGEGLVWTFSSGPDASLAAQSYIDEVEETRRVALDELVAPLVAHARDAGVSKLEPRLIRGAPRAVIADQARFLGADVIVMGTVARTGLSGVIIGNTAEDILNNVQRSVVTVKPHGFVSPVTPVSQYPAMP